MSQIVNDRHSRRVADAHTCGASPVVKCSGGPERDLNSFYCTRYSTTHNGQPWHPDDPLPNMPPRDAQSKKMAAGGIGGYYPPGGVPSQMQKQRTGYTKNLVPFVRYNKSVDEGPHLQFQVGNPFVSTHTTFFASPSSPRDYIAEGDNNINMVIESGFTRLPKWKVTDDGTKPVEKRSTTKSHHEHSYLHFKEASHNKSKIIPSATAYISDEANIKDLGNGEVFDRFYRPPRPTEPSWRDFNTTHMKESGYSRSTFKDAVKLRPGVEMDLNPAQFPAHITERIKKNDPTRWVHLVDKQARTNVSRILHDAPDPSMALARELRQGPIEIGSKEPTGGVRNNPKFIYEPEPAPVERFSTESGRRFAAPRESFDPNNFKCDKIVKSGFSDGNRYKYINPHTRDAQAFAKLHPTEAQRKWIAENGLHTRVPTRPGYQLKVES
ncbi:uncharacterized protein BJ171DRAFT_599345 [Polychytrium aggregatum]|uniref:uncharacterized protein n=1 Tax=Polychytrium aggregatum TaxID=110093 RepID=UPI0022FE8C0A|nr:uncharacterized protein BJ171DRAFT_599345 [Polychytrium aggregatum]KAI9204161.1 hypothetical protein BJ171DRAFT_599345 [Polychytrium aggregatum]